MFIPFQYINTPVLCALAYTLYAMTASSSAIGTERSKPHTSLALQAEHLETIGGVMNPEDLIVIPNSEWVIGSSMGKPGRLFSFNTRDNTIRTLNLDTHSGAKQPGSVTSLSDSCPGKITSKHFEPHGINLNTKRDAMELLVINHGSRESVEIFDLSLTSTGPELRWKDCIVIPENHLANSVVPLPNNGVAITSMFNPNNTQSGALMQRGEPTGAILEWSAEKGWITVDHSQISGNNGLEISDDGNWYFVTGWASQTLLKLHRKNPEEKRTYISFNFLPDNVRWTKEGDLLIAGHGSSVNQFFKCQKDIENCVMESTLVKIQAPTMRVIEQINISGTEVLGLASVAIESNNTIYVGSFAKDAILVIERNK